MYVRFLLWLMPYTWKADLIHMIEKYGEDAEDFVRGGEVRSEEVYNRYCDSWGKITDHIGF